MKGLRMIPVVTLLGLAACLPSLHPLYTEEDLVFAPELVGLWKPKDGKASWEFKEVGPKEYKLIYTDKDGKPGEFEARLVKLGDHLFLDLFPKEPKLKANDFYKFHLLPTHAIMKVQAVKPDLQLEMLDPEWFDKLVERDPKAIKHEVIEGAHRTVITASTGELQRFVLKYVDNEEAWGDALRLHRREAEQPASAESTGASEGP